MCTDALDPARCFDQAPVMTDRRIPEHVSVNRAHWDEDAPNWVADGERNWRSGADLGDVGRSRCPGCCPTT